MARVLVSYYKVQETSIKKRLCFFDGFVRELKACGNDVYVINTAYFNPYKSNVVSDPRLDKAILDAAINFDPELIITFNHRIPKSILDHFDVPIIVWDGDALMYFCDQEYLAKNKSRYQIFTISKGWMQDYLDFGFSKDAVHFVPQATAVTAKEIPLVANVSFLGCRLFHNEYLPKKMIRHKYLQSCRGITDKFFETNSYDYEAYLEEFLPYSGLSQEYLFPLFDYRWLALSNVMDLGLRIAGHKSRWEDMSLYAPQLMAHYDSASVWTLDDNIDFYNSSRVSMCPLSAQAQGDAFSWRVFDVMASNACLLISESKQLRELTKGEVEVPMYSTPWDAREKCIYLLENEAERKQIVAASQQYVDRHARWEHRFLDAQQITGVSLVDSGFRGSLRDGIFDDVEVEGLIFKAEHEASAAHRYFAGCSVGDESSEELPAVSEPAAENQAPKEARESKAGLWKKILSKGKRLKKQAVLASSFAVLFLAVLLMAVYGTRDAEWVGMVLVALCSVELLAVALAVAFRGFDIIKTALRAIREKGDGVSPVAAFYASINKRKNRAFKAGAGKKLAWYGLPLFATGCALCFGLGEAGFGLFGALFVGAGATFVLCGVVLIVAKKAIRNNKSQVSIRKMRHEKKDQERIAFLRKQFRSHDKIRVGFYISLPSLWLVYRGLYRTLLEDDKFEPVVLAMPQIDAWKITGYPILETLQADGVEYVRGYDPETEEYVDVAGLEIDYFIHNRTYLSRRPKSFSNEMMRETSKLCYIPYVACVAKGKTEAIVCGFGELKHFDVVFAENERLEKIYERYRAKEKAEYVDIALVGSPKFDLLHKSLGNAGRSERLAAYKQVALYTPRWSTEVDNTCTFFDYIDYFFDLVARNEDVCFIFRPHPLMATGVGQVDMGVQRWNAFLERFESIPNAELDLDPDYEKSFMDATVLISDLSSMMEEFSLTGKPIVYCEKADVLNDFGEALARGFYRCRNLDDLAYCLDRLREGIDPLAPARKRVLEECFSFEGATSSEKILDYIKEDFERTKGGR